LYISSNIRVIKSRQVRWAETCSTHVEVGNAYNILVMKPEGKTIFGKARNR